MIQAGDRLVQVEDYHDLTADGQEVVRRRGRYGRVLSVGGRTVAMVFPDGTEHGSEELVPLRCLRRPMSITYTRESGGLGPLGSHVELHGCPECFCLVADRVAALRGHVLWHEAQQPPLDG